jgi:hypothetical protein
MAQENIKCEFVTMERKE